MLAQMTPDDALAVFDTWWIYVTPLLPFLQSILVRSDSARWAKIVISLGFAAALAVMSLGTLDWSTATAEVVILRLGTAWTVGQVVYKAASDRLGAGSLNDLIVPGFGVRVGRAREVIEAAASEVRDRAGD